MGVRALATRTREGEGKRTDGHGDARVLGKGKGEGLGADGEDSSGRREERERGEEGLRKGRVEAGEVEDEGVRVHAGIAGSVHPSHGALERVGESVRAREGATHALASPRSRRPLAAQGELQRRARAPMPPRASTSAAQGPPREGKKLSPLELKLLTAGLAAPKGVRPARTGTTRARSEPHTDAPASRVRSRSASMTSSPPAGSASTAPWRASTPSSARCVRSQWSHTRAPAP